MKLRDLELWFLLYCFGHLDVLLHGFNSCRKPHHPGVSATRDTRTNDDLDYSHDYGLSDSVSKDSQRSRLLKALQLVQRQVANESICSPNHSVVLDIAFDHARWKSEALLAVEVANLLSSLWRVKSANGFSMVENDTFLYNLVRSNVLFSSSVFGSVVCFERGQYRKLERFCPYAFRDKAFGGAVHVKDISVGHDYLHSSETIWWREPRQKALNRTVKNSRDIYKVRLNASMAVSQTTVSVPVAQYEEDGYWTRPYYDCFGGNIWMITFLAPFFNDSNKFL